MRVLGIETSCDDTGVAIFDSEQGLLAHAVHNQTATHVAYGGVVPELASRDHAYQLLHLIKKILAEAKLSPASINGIAYTAGPGLIGALLVGASFAKALGYTWQIPTLGVHHMEGHLLAVMLEGLKPPFPFLSLLISGGHTLLVEVQAIGNYRLLGESLDDAAGEAFDKVAKLLGLPYPGGAALEALAKQGIPGRFHFPRPLTDKPGLDFSFSGLKTFTANTLRTTSQSLQDKADIALEFQNAIIETLFIKCKRAIKATGIQHLVIAGGVSANQTLRHQLAHLSHFVPVSLYYPRIEFCTDNGAMIAYTGCQRLKFSTDQNFEIQVYPRWPIDSLKK